MGERGGAVERGERVGLAPEELAAWRGFLQAHALLVRQLDAELVAAHGLPLSWYDVLVVLDAAGGRLRMSELARAVILSGSGTTRLVDRMERAGLIVRERCEDDRRGFNAIMTEAGAARRREARPTHLAGVRRRFLDVLTPEDRSRLAALWPRVTEAAAGA
jgi:DNA-binding MarR family transcriptional regulator